MPLFQSAVSRFTPCFVLSCMVAMLSACGSNDNDGQDATATASATAEHQQLSDAALLGRQIFFDKSLSASGNMACASCHDPANAHAPADSRFPPLGGADGNQPGFRAVPSLRYLQLSPGFSFDEEDTPSGGFNWDGRAQSLAEQAQRPFLAPHEMANASKEDVIGRLKKAPYAAQFQSVFGAGIFDTPAEAFDRVAFALQQYQKEDTAFYPFDSKYDQFLDGKVDLSPGELRGLKLFNDPAKGNCAACHTSARSADGMSPLFTDFTYDNLGVPRNKAIPATADPAYFDLGLCGPDRADLAARTEVCGAFKVPTLRNVATRKTYFHNGAFTSLHDVLRFYVRRDTHPEEWYPRAADGSLLKFDDLPPAYRENVNTTEAPYNRQPGMMPALNEEEIEDIVRFLGTLTDGYKPVPDSR